MTHYEKKARLATPQRALAKRNFGFGLSVVINPGGRGYNAAGVKTDNAVVLGMRTEVHF